VKGREVKDGAHHLEIAWFDFRVFGHIRQSVHL
jgi:hypothetical protein